MHGFRSLVVAVCVMSTLLMAGCATERPGQADDPLQPLNRVTFKFNEKADQYLMRPIARGYVKVTPRFVRTGVTNFFSNLFYPTTIVNDFLQAKFVRGGKDIGRFVVNSTVGILGFFDVAKYWGMPKHDEDFGQTLGYWGVQPGWYLVLPLLGPSDVRDGIGRAVDLPLNPLYYPSNSTLTWSAFGVDAVNTRAMLLKADQFVQNALDPYLFVRDAYLQHRRSLIYDGNPPPELPQLPPSGNGSSSQGGSGNAALPPPPSSGGGANKGKAAAVGGAL